MVKDVLLSEMSHPIQRLLIECNVLCDGLPKLQTVFF